MSDSSVKSSAQKINSSGGNETNSAFADAVQRARQLAAKIHSTGESNSLVSSGTKRPLEDSMNGVADGTPEIKKMASSDPYGQVQGMQQRNGAGVDFVVEEYQVPDKMVGLIIGRGGEQIIRLQTETGCKIQLASDSSGSPSRPCTLTGSREAVEKLGRPLSSGDAGTKTAAVRTLRLSQENSFKNLLNAVSYILALKQKALSGY